MNNILYRDLKSELLDRLGNSVMGKGPAGEVYRQKKSSDVVIARAATRGMIELLRTMTFTSVPDLVQTLTLSGTKNRDKVYSYPFPEQAMTEREDLGMISFVLDGEEMDFESSRHYQEVVSIARSSMYGNMVAFNVDMSKRRIYVANTDVVKAVVLRKPHSIYAPIQNMYAGATLTMTVNGGTTATATFSDGIGNSVSVDIDSGDTISEVHLKYVDAINADEDISYNAVYNDDGFVQLYHRYSLEADKQLDPSVTANGTGTYQVEDTGTYEIPILYHYIDDLVRLALPFLLDNISQLTQPQEAESE